MACCRTPPFYPSRSLMLQVSSARLLGGEMGVEAGLEDVWRFLDPFFFGDFGKKHFFDPRSLYDFHVAMFFCKVLEHWSSDHLVGVSSMKCTWYLMNFQLLQEGETLKLHRSPQRRLEWNLLFNPVCDGLMKPSPVENGDPRDTKASPVGRFYFYVGTTVP